ncbi:AAA family ATPase [Candidatus Parcubacteria bacterium]|nr:MAG: AAA family ATPase [Candidatus Parcubacteria bacterium]
MIIEFYGLPGSGKTTVARRLSQELNIPIIKVRRRREVIWHSIKFFLRQPIKAAKLLKLVFKHSHFWQEFYYKLMNCWFDYNAKYSKGLKYPVAILDQGHFQNIVSLFDEEVAQKELKRFLNLLPCPDLLVVFDIPESQRQIALQKRGYLARQNFPSSYLKKWQEAFEHNHKLFLEVLPDLNLPHVFFKEEVDYKKLKEKVKNLI